MARGLATHPARSVLGRALVGLVGLSVYYAGLGIPIPSVLLPTARIPLEVAEPFDQWRLPGALNLGLVPAFLGFAVVELVASVTARIRGRTTIDHRRRRRWSVAATVVLAAPVALLRAYALRVEYDFPTEASLLAPAATFFAGAILTLLLAWLVSRFGLGTGVGVLLLFGTFDDAARLLASLREAALSLSHAAAAATACGAAALVVLVTLRVLARGETNGTKVGAEARPRVPVAGTVLMWIAVGIVAMPPWLENLEIPIGAWHEPVTVRPALFLVTTIALAALLAECVLQLRRLGPRRTRVPAWRDRALSHAFVAFVLACATISAGFGGVDLSPFALTLAGATFFDAWSDAAFRLRVTRPSRLLVCHGLEDADRARATLLEHGIDTRIRGSALRTLLRGTAHLEELEMLVDEKDVVRARAAVDGSGSSSGPVVAS